VCDGAVKTLPAIIPIPTYEVRVEAGEIYVDVE
jgi:nitrite reductase/ring-hydroxylating ferredoxin subunit